MKKITLLFAASLFALAAIAQNTYTLDKYHARLSFSVVHFGISHIEGNFKTFDATFSSAKNDFAGAQIGMTADIKSINTEVEIRDNDLRSSNFFDADKYPTMTFKSTSFKKISAKNYKLKGNITLHGITKTIEFDVVYNGTALNPMSKKHSCGFTITGKLMRTAFGIGGDPLTTGVSNEIQLLSNVEFVIN